MARSLSASLAYSSKTQNSMRIKVSNFSIKQSNFIFTIDQEKQHHLPISRDLVLITYEDTDEERIGQVLFYPTKNKTFLLESDKNEH